MSAACLFFPAFHVFPNVFPKDGSPSNPRNGQGGRRIHGFMQETT